MWNVLPLAASSRPGDKARRAPSEPGSFNLQRARYGRSGHPIGARFCADCMQTSRFISCGHSVWTMVLKVAITLAPVAHAPALITTAITPAIKTYSIPVTPLLSLNMDREREHMTAHRKNHGTHRPIYSGIYPVKIYLSIYDYRYFMYRLHPI